MPPTLPAAQTPYTRRRALQAFPPPRRAGSSRRFEWHYTPKHGSWLDMAESELGVLASQCLDRRIADKQILAHEVTHGSTPQQAHARPTGNSKPPTPASS